MKFVDRPSGLQTGQASDFSVTVKSSKYPLRVVLAYTDAPGSALVNDLNLFVEGPSGERYVGNQTQEDSTKLDTGNNVEVVNIRKPKTGKWTIRIVGSNVPKGPQDYALVYLGAF